MNNTQKLMHYGVKGMKWGVRKKTDDDITISKNTDIHRLIPSSWLEKEKKLTGYAYASYKKEDTEQYKKFARLFGDGNNYFDMTFKAKDVLISPSEKKRVDEFIKLIDSNSNAREALLKKTRNPILYMRKNTLDKLDNQKNVKKAYRKFTYLLASTRELRDPYFKELEKQGYNMIVDDSDIIGGISKTPIIVFDRKKTLSLDKVDVVGR